MKIFNKISTLLEEGGISFDALVDVIFQDFSTINTGGPSINIAITGPSCVGKTTLANKIVNTFTESGISATKISLDSYLLDKHKGNGQFRKQVYEELSPLYFDWEALAKDIILLNNNTEVVIDNYVRGVGWSHNSQKLKAARVIIIEGLFLDSIEANCNIFTTTIVIEASRENIQEWRTKRDISFRHLYGKTFRTEQQTLEEIERTIESYAKYSRSKPHEEYIKLGINKNFEIESAQSVI